MQKMPDGTKISRAPSDMQSWEVVAPVSLQLS
jgi:hypothetical protein